MVRLEHSDARHEYVAPPHMRGLYLLIGISQLVLVLFMAYRGGVVLPVVCSIVGAASLLVFVYSLRMPFIAFGASGLYVRLAFWDVPEHYMWEDLTSVIGGRCQQFCLNTREDRKIFVPAPFLSRQRLDALVARIQKELGAPSQQEQTPNPPDEPNQP